MKSKKNNPQKDYNSSLIKHGESPQALKWRTYRAAAIRYRQLVSELNPEGKKIMDVGCGMGDVLPFIYSKANRFTYLGVDKNKVFIEIARKRYAGHEFKVMNPFKDKPLKKSDIVLCSGALNGCENGDWIQDRKLKVKILFDMAGETLAFNMAGGNAENHTEKNIGYVNVKEMLGFCLSLTPKIILKDHYHPKDFTVFMFK